MNLFTKQKQTYRFVNKFRVTKGDSQGEGITQELGLNKHTPLCVRQITNKDLLYSAGNSTQYPVTAYMRKESMEE